jgi:hypothetical protein
MASRPCAVCSCFRRASPHSGAATVRRASAVAHTLREGVALVDNDSPDVMIAKRLLDHAKLCGFEFRRVAPGEDGPLVGQRVIGDWEDEIRIDGFSRGCFARRKRVSSLIVPESVLVERRVDGGALDVLCEVLTWEPQP